MRREHLLVIRCVQTWFITVTFMYTDQTCTNHMLVNTARTQSHESECMRWNQVTHQNMSSAVRENIQDILQLLTFSLGVWRCFKFMGWFSVIITVLFSHLTKETKENMWMRAALLEIQLYYYTLRLFMQKMELWSMFGASRQEGFDPQPPYLDVFVRLWELCTEFCTISVKPTRLHAFQKSSFDWTNTVNQFFTCIVCKSKWFPFFIVVSECWIRSSSAFQNDTLFFKFKNL